MPPELRCEATCLDGTPYEAPAKLIDEKTGLCRSHDPAKREAIKEAARRGGEATARRFRAVGLGEDELPPLTSPVGTDGYGRVDDEQGTDTMLTQAADP